jgi:hypothetical protein
MPDKEIKELFAHLSVSGILDQTIKEYLIISPPHPGQRNQAIVGSSLSIWYS